jgi:hypothetical protein
VNDNLPTARTMLPHSAGCACSCGAKRATTHHQAPADLRALIDAGRGGVPIKDLRFRCTRCGSRLTDSVVMARDAMQVQPWGPPPVSARLAGSSLG